MRRFPARSLVAPSLLVLSLAACAGQVSRPASATAPAAQVEPAPEARPAPLSALVDAVNIPYERFTLPNGLTVLVNTDRKAPVVAVAVWYGVGSKHEPRGKTGFAHLFEHLMFYGTPHVPGDFFQPLTQAGATDMNGTTWLDRTNYFETVPTGALDRALMMESDRMGYLLGAMTQKRLDAQRAVVQNEKRQRDNQPYGLVEYEQLEALYPAGHPYRHSTIGSMADLDAASLADVKAWFRDHYGPNNAILVLSGDIDLATAKEKAAKWFAPIPAGPKVEPVAVPVPTLGAPLTKTIRDSVATTRIYRMWAIPGYDNPDYLPLQVSAVVLGGLASSRLDDALVRQKQLAVSVTASGDVFAQGGQFVAQVDVKPGADPAAAAAALDAEITRLAADGPTADELTRALTVIASGQIRALESVGGDSGKTQALAEGLLFSGDPERTKAELARAATLTPDDVRAATRTWLTRPAFALTVEPGARTEGGEQRGGDGLGPLPKARAARAAPAARTALAFADPADRSKLPAVGEVTALDFPAIERATLSNGMKVYFARRAAVPAVSVRVSFDAGYAADPKDALGTGALLLQLMDEGTTTRDSTELARARERLGAQINGFATADATSFQLDAMAPNLAPSLDLLADYVRRPALAPAELERVRAQQLAAISAETSDPQSLASRTLYPVLYGPAHPYGIAPSGRGEAGVVARLTQADLAAFHRRWLRPDKARVFIVGDTTLSDVTRLLERSFGDWQAPAEPAPAKDFSAPIPAPRPRILLIDRPGVPQSMIMAGEPIAAKGTDDLVALRSANDVFGGDFLSRLNTNLRETKGWTYGTSSGLNDRLDRLAYLMVAPVQADKTGPAIAEMRRELTEYVTTKGARPDELAWSTSGSARELPGMFETSGAVLDAVAKIVTYGRPDNFYQTLPERYRTMTPADLDAAIRAKVDPRALTWVVVGDARTVRPQLEGLGLPVEVVAPAAAK
ncbi:insulinase family protein [Novosphingobium sp. KCTC 2891]|uniref:M16 family metallopeptidase n=1 Tax=Novosphingobium sp. KCTC 2891 TaxID=2989730 RepID=UPI0022224680|nr:pitrilysin family protein [Novosphingobium sp. KCTC 2891]MCW1383973.1 insulinase family protein [Novosphingobium sp. KCTC 2891]